MTIGRLTPQRIRRVGVALLLGAALLMLSLENLRDRTELPNFAWFLFVVLLLAAGGAATAYGSSTYAVPARGRRVARVMLVAGAVGLGFGGIAAAAPDAPWAEGTRALAALGFISAFAVLPAAAVLARRASRDLALSRGANRPPRAP